MTERGTEREIKGESEREGIRDSVFRKAERERKKRGERKRKRERGAEGKGREKTDRKREPER